MNLHSSPSRWAARQHGGAFITVMMFTMVMFLLAGSILGWSLTERRLNNRAAVWLEARNAAEAAAEYGFAQIVSQFNSYATPPSFTPGGSNALVAPPAAFFSGGHVNTAAYSTSNPTGIELIAGGITTVPSTGSLFFVDPANPDNARDTMINKWVFRRDVQVLARATVVPSVGSPITSYVTQKVSIRGAPLFAFAIFYSANDLEASPGPVLDIYGPVHVNGNMFPLAQGSVETGSPNSVNFHGSVTMTGDLYHAWATTTLAAQGRGYSSSSSVLDGEPLGYDPVTFANAAGTQVALKGTDGIWKDSTMGSRSQLFTDSQGRYTDTTTPAIEQLKTKLSADFRSYASQTWGGKLQTAAHGVQAYHPISFSQAIDSGGTLPNPHSIIDPPTPPTSGDPYFSAKQEVETQKFANQAGLYIQVAVTPGTAGAPDTATVTLYGPANSAPTGTPAADIGPNGGIRLGTVPSDLVEFIGYKATVPGSTTAGATRVVVAHALSYTGSGTSRKYRWTTTRTTTTGGTITKIGTLTSNGSGGYNDLPLVSGTALASGATFSGGSAVSDPSTSSGYDFLTSSYSGSTTSAKQANAQAAALAAANAVLASGTTYSLTGTPTSQVTSVTNAQVNQGLYDQRQESGVNLVQLDMSELNAALTNTNSGTNADGKAIVTSGGAVWGAGTWNGGVYVEVKSATGSGFPGQTSVALANGKVASGSSMLPTVNSVNGLTIATNAPLYVLGNFNADGSNASTATSATTPDDGHTNSAGGATSAQIPVALAADAITILSPGYFGSPHSTKGSSASATNSSGTGAYENLENASWNATASSEVAAAFITGIVPTQGSTFSGGVHNLPRFIERWGSNSVAIRGSLVSLYASNVATGPWAQRYYSAPKRVWGFDQTFANGTYPPLTPRVMSYRRIDFTDMSASEYATARHTLWPSIY